MGFDASYRTGGGKVHRSPKIFSRCDHQFGFRCVSLLYIGARNGGRMMGATNDTELSVGCLPVLFVSRICSSGGYSTQADLLLWAVTTDGLHADDLLRPVFMGCATKNAKVIAIALGSLQRLITLRAISLSALPAVIQTINDCMTQGVDIQLKILQTLLSLITNFPAIHGRLLADVSNKSHIVGVHSPLMSFLGASPLLQAARV